MRGMSVVGICLCMAVYVQCGTILCNIYTHINSIFILKKFLTSPSLHNNMTNHVVFVKLQRLCIELTDKTHTAVYRYQAGRAVGVSLIKTSWC